jgi:hypothetical protein
MIYGQFKLTFPVIPNFSLTVNRVQQFSSYEVTKLHSKKSVCLIISPRKRSSTQRVLHFSPQRLF